MSWTEVGFRRSVITNFSELKEHVVTRRKGKPKILGKRLDEWLTRINSVEKNFKHLGGAENHGTRTMMHKTNSQ